MFYKPTENPAGRMPLIEERSALMLQAMEEMDYDGINIGWLDPYLPAEMLRGFDEKTSFPFLGTNTYDAEGNRPFAPWAIREYDGFRVGLFGLVSRQTPTIPGSGERNFTIGDHVAAARKAVAVLKSKTDIIVALTSLGIADDTELARAVPGIDVILGGLDRRVTYQAQVEKGTVIVQAGSKGMRLGRLDLEFRGKGGGWKQGKGGDRTFTWAVVSLGANIPDEPRIAGMLKEYRQRLKEKNVAFQVNRPPAEASPYAGITDCRDCHLKAFNEWLETGHAGAFSTLAATNQDGNPDCLPCHVTAYGVRGGFVPGGTPDLRTVQCEACHRAGRRHRGNPRSKAFIRAQVPEEVCVGCHTRDNSPEFDYKPYLRKLSPHTDKLFKKN